MFYIYVYLYHSVILGFALNKENQVDSVCKNLVVLVVLRPVGTRPGVMYELCKVDKDIVKNCSLFSSQTLTFQGNLYYLVD